eukprot:TRINITY_DN5647_c0_g1_i1.p1 TRINITY_DN5647_c0_g1~~TRINITY_DN5647_c0_g1_i1.p1  ORF type:complete len:503 (+),score=96.53 TRINITY_DN5647_c0_g1_i1:137-1645(+)
MNDRFSAALLLLILLLPGFCLCFGVVERACGDVVTFTQPTGTFDDGSGDTAPYLPNLRCRYRIAPKDAKFISISFSKFALESSSTMDYVIVTLPDGTWLGTYSGAQPPQPFHVLSSAIDITFYTDARLQGDGWTIDYTSSSLAELSTDQLQLLHPPGDDDYDDSLAVLHRPRWSTRQQLNQNELNVPAQSWTYYGFVPESAHVYITVESASPLQVYVGNVTLPSETSYLVAADHFNSVELSDLRVRSMYFIGVKNLDTVPTRVFVTVNEAQDASSSLSPLAVTAIVLGCLCLLTCIIKGIHRAVLGCKPIEHGDMHQFLGDRQAERDPSLDAIPAVVIDTHQHPQNFTMHSEPAYGQPSQPHTPTSACEPITAQLLFDGKSLFDSEVPPTLRRTAPIPVPLQPQQQQQPNVFNIADLASPRGVPPPLDEETLSQLSHETQVLVLTRSAPCSVTVPQLELPRRIHEWGRSWTDTGVQQNTGVNADANGMQRGKKLRFMSSPAA